MTDSGWTYDGRNAHKETTRTALSTSARASARKRAGLMVDDKSSVILQDYQIACGIVSIA